MRIQEECVGLPIALCCHLTHGTANLVRKCWSQQDKEKTEKLVSPCLWASSIMHTLCCSLPEWQMATRFTHEAGGWSTEGAGIDFYRRLGHMFRWPKHHLKCSGSDSGLEMGPKDLIPSPLLPSPPHSLKTRNVAIRVATGSLLLKWLNGPVNKSHRAVLWRRAIVSMTSQGVRQSWLQLAHQYRLGERDRYNGIEGARLVRVLWR